MALIDKASLLMVPSTYEDGTLYNVLPSGNKAPDETGNHNGYDQTRADFTFSRGSNLAATRVNADGLIEKGRENLLLQSNQFDTTWAKSATITITSGQTGYNGGSDAWLLTKTSGVGYQGLRQSISTTGVQTASIYAKAGTLNEFAVYIDGGSRPYVVVDLSNGTIIGQRGTEIDTNIEDVGSGWYRISFAFNETSSDYWIYPDWSNTNTGNLYIQNAQLEYGLAASSYLDSGATTATAGVLENTPRIDYSSGAGALLLEPQRTNVITNSEYIGSSSFGQGSGTDVLDNQIVSPDGTQNAGKVIANTTTNGDHYLNQSFQPPVSSSTAYVFSVFAKKGELQYIQVGSNIQGAAYKQVYVNLNDGTIESSNYTITPIVEDYGNGWYRISVFGTTGSAQTSADVYIVALNDSQSRYYTGNGTDGLYTWGWQLEAGSYVSSYVPTYGSAATRGADSCSVTGVSDVIGQTEGTIYGEIDFQQTESAARFIAIGDGTSNNRIAIFTNSSNDGFRVFVNNGGTTQVDSSIAVSKGIVKFALGYSNNDYALYVDGVSRITDTSASVPACSNVYLGRQEISLTNVLGSGIKQAVLFNERLSNSELADLTA